MIAEVEYFMFVAESVNPIVFESTDIFNLLLNNIHIANRIQPKGGKDMSVIQCAEPAQLKKATSASLV